MRELALALVSAGVPPVVAVSIVAMWLTGDWRALSLVTLSAGLIGTGIVGYFDWRAKLRRRILSEPDDYRRAA